MSAAVKPLLSGEIYVNRKLGAVTKLFCLGGFQWKIDYDREKDVVVGVLLNPAIDSSMTATVRISDVKKRSSFTTSHTVAVLSVSNRRFEFENKEEKDDVELLIEVLDYEGVRFDCCYDFSAKNTRADRILCVGDQKFHVESAVLAIYSDYFAKLFEGGFSESGMVEIDLNDFNADDFGTFLSCIFPTCKLPIDDENFSKLARMADFYCCTHVKVKCAQYLMSAKFVSIFKYDFANLYNLPVNGAKLYADILNKPKGQLKYCTGWMANITADAKDALLCAFAGCRPAWLERRAAMK